MYMYLLLHSQAVRQCALTARCVSSNLTGAAILKLNTLCVFLIIKKRGILMTDIERNELAEILFPHITRTRDEFEQKYMDLKILTQIL